MTRDEAVALLHQRVENENLRKHCYASEAIMRRLARELGEDPDVWGLAGVLHDVDFEETKEAPDRHGRVAAEHLSEAGVDAAAVDAIRHHNAEGLGLERSTRFHHALAAAETITGLIVATALVYPDKKLASVKAKFILKRMKKKDFARAVSRETIMECEQLDMALERFVQVSLEAMQETAETLGL